MKQPPRIWTMLWMTLLLLAFKTDECASGQEAEAVAAATSKDLSWASSLARVEAKLTGLGMTGIVVKADSDVALILTTFQLPLDDNGFFRPIGEEVTVAIKSRDGKLHKVPGTVQNTFGHLIQSSSGAKWLTTIVEVKHNGLQLSAVSIADTVPQKDMRLVAIGRHLVNATDPASFENGIVISEINPATSYGLLGQLSGTSFQAESLLSVHDRNGTLVGIGSMSGGFGGGGFGGGGGFFAIPDPLSNRIGDSAPDPISFLSVVDRAQELRDVGVPVSDAAITLQNKRMRIYRDSFSRPVQSPNVQITWSDDHKQLHGFSASQGEWARLNIDEQDVITPIVGNNVGAVILNGKIAGYSPTVGRWDVLTLLAGSKAVPAISDDVATVRDGKDYYTFASSSGTWTSPTNPDYQQHSVTVQIPPTFPKGPFDDLLRDTNTNVVFSVSGTNGHITGMRHHVLAAERLLKEILDKQPNSAATWAEGPGNSLPNVKRFSRPGTTEFGSEPGGFPESISPSEQQSLNLAKQLRSQTGLTAEEKSRLTEFVTKALDEKLQRQRDTATSLRKKLETIEKALQSREANRDRIIERRVEELLDPNINWSALRPSAPAQFPGLPATGTAVDLPTIQHGEATNTPAVAP